MYIYIIWREHAEFDAKLSFAYHWPDPSQSFISSEKDTACNYSKNQGEAFTETGFVIIRNSFSIRSNILGVMSPSWWPDATVDATNWPLSFSLANQASVCAWPACFHGWGSEHHVQALQADAKPAEPQTKFSSGQTGQRDAKVWERTPASQEDLNIESSHLSLMVLGLR